MPDRVVTAPLSFAMNAPKVYNKTQEVNWHSFSKFIVNFELIQYINP